MAASRGGWLIAQCDMPYAIRDARNAMNKFQQLLESSNTVLADGAMGTMLFEAGLQFGDPPEVWNVAHPDQVRAVHRGYLEAGSKIILTNTFGGNRFRLAMHNLQGQVAHLNRTAAVILRAEVDAAGTGALVAGDLGPSGARISPLGVAGIRRGRGRVRRAGRRAHWRRRR